MEDKADVGVADPDVVTDSTTISHSTHDIIPSFARI